MWVTIKILEPCSHVVVKYPTLNLPKGKKIRLFYDGVVVVVVAAMIAATKETRKDFESENYLIALKLDFSF